MLDLVWLEVRILEADHDRSITRSGSHACADIDHVVAQGFSVGRTDDFVPPQTLIVTSTEGLHNQHAAILKTSGLLDHTLK